MKLEDITPELANKLHNKYLDNLISLDITKMTPEQKAISNGLYAIHALEFTKTRLMKESYINSLSSPYKERVIATLNDMLQAETEMLEESMPYLLDYLATL